MIITAGRQRATLLVRAMDEILGTHNGMARSARDRLADLNHQYAQVT